MLRLCGYKALGNRDFQRLWVAFWAMRRLRRRLTSRTFPSLQLSSRAAATSSSMSSGSSSTHAMYWRNTGASCSRLIRSSALFQSMRFARPSSMRFFFSDAASCWV